MTSFAKLHIPVVVSMEAHSDYGKDLCMANLLLCRSRCLYKPLAVPILQFDHKDKQSCSSEGLYNGNGYIVLSGI